MWIGLVSLYISFRMVLMGNLGEILKGSVARLGITRQVEAVDIVEKATTEIEKIIPREDFEVVSFKDGVLKIYTPSSSAASQIKLSLSSNFLNSNKIKRLVFTHQSVDTQQP